MTEFMWFSVAVLVSTVFILIYISIIERNIINSKARKSHTASSILKRRYMCHSKALKRKR